MADEAAGASEEGGSSGAGTGAGSGASSSKPSGKAKAGGKAAARAANGTTRKRPLSAYMSFNQRKSPSLRAQFPAESMPEIGKRVGAEWRAMSDEEQRPYKEQAAALLTQWKADESEESGVQSLPKRPMSAFMLFHVENRQRVTLENPEAPITEIGAKVGVLWRELTPEQQQPYKDTFHLALEKWKTENAPAVAANRRAKKQMAVKAAPAAAKGGKYNASSSSSTARPATAYVNKAPISATTTTGGPSCGWTLPRVASPMVSSPMVSSRVPPRE